MEESLSNLLKDWKVPQTYIDKLCEQEVFDIDTLKLLSDVQVKAIFDKIGSQANFLKNLKQLRELEDIEMTPADLFHVASHVIDEYLQMKSLVVEEIHDDQSTGKTAETPGSDPHEEFPDFESTVQQQTSVESGGELNNNVTGNGNTNRTSKHKAGETSGSGGELNSNETGNGNASRTSKHKAGETESPVARKRLAIHNVFEIELEQLLKSCLKGKEVLAYYELNQDLNESHRNKLADVMLNHYLKDDHERKLPHDVEEDMAAAVTALFDSELKEIWISDNSFQREKSVGRGILIKRYYHIRRGLRKGGVIVKSKDSKQNSLDENTEDDDEITEKLSWLLYNKQPWPKLIEFWKATSHSRLRDHIGGSESVKAYMDKFIGLKDKSGYLLLESDFETRFPNANSFYTQWPMFAAFVEKKAPAKIQEAIKDSLTPEGKKVNTIIGLAHLLNVITVARNKHKTYRPSNDAVSECLLLMVKTVGDIKPALAARVQMYEPFHLQLSPQAMIVGDDADSIQKSFVGINDVIYEVENPIKALDVAFKSMHVLDSKYPEEGKREFLFLERAIYNINENKKGLPAAVSSLVRDFNNFKTGSA